jgi:hypothetical protein
LAEGKLSFNFRPLRIVTSLIGKQAMAQGAFIPSAGAALPSGWNGIARSSYSCRRSAVSAPGKLPGARAHAHVPSRRGKTVPMGLIPFVPDWLAFGAWCYGAYRFYLGFNETSYQKVRNALASLVKTPCHLCACLPPS